MLRIASMQTGPLSGLPSPGMSFVIWAVERMGWRRRTRVRVRRVDDDCGVGMTGGFMVGTGSFGGKSGWWCLESRELLDVGTTS